MSKVETKKANLQKLIEDIEKKIERLEAQRKVYQLSLESLEDRKSSRDSEEN